MCSEHPQCCTFSAPQLVRGGEGAARQSQVKAMKCSKRARLLSACDPRMKQTAALQLFS